MASPYASQTQTPSTEVQSAPIPTGDADRVGDRAGDRGDRVGNGFEERWARGES